MNNTLTSDEIDLLQLITTIWNGKWKIVAITTVCVSVVFGFQAFGPVPNFVAKTEIRPIISNDAEQYLKSNAFGFFAVYRDIEAKDQAQLSVREKNTERNQIPSAVLDQLFIEQIANPHLLASIVKKQELLIRDDFDDDEDYERALMQFIAQISILPPGEEGRRYWTLHFEFNDQDKWLATLAELKKTANENVRNAIKSRFENLQASAKQKREFAIEDLDAEISILIAADDTKTKRRLARLTEQAAIARKLGISKQTSIPQPSVYQSLNAQDAESLEYRFNEIESEMPLYLRGYDALEKEIDLIKERKDKRVFIERLLPLETKKLILSANQLPERAERLFDETPVMKSSGFQATSFDVASTEFKYETNSTLLLFLAATVGIMVGVFYVIIADAVRAKKEQDATT